MKFVFCCVLVFRCFSSGAATDTELELKGTVDPNLNIERIGEGGEIDVFSKREVLYRIVSNIDKDVDVVFTSRNGWVLKSDEGNEIPYEGVLYENKDETIINKDNSTKTISKDRFTQQKCEFGVVFSAKDSIENYSAGSYSDKIQISLVAK